MSQTLPAPSNLLQRVAAGAQAVISGALGDEAFKATRLAVGAHRQRQGDGYMLRLRVPGGRLSLEQWAAVADVAAAHASRVHLTLRQDLQLYHVDLSRVAAAAADLNRRGLSTYAAGGSTVRNITCGILGDQDPAAPFDPYPYASALSARLSLHPLFNALPRKFKIGFAGPGPEAAQGWLNDLGFIPRRMDGGPGFRVVAGGGLGASPQNAFEMEAFIPAAAVGPYGEAALEYFALVSPKDRPMSNRFKFILRELGADKVRGEIQARLAGKQLDAVLPDAPAAEGRALWVEMPVGDLSPAQMRGLAAAVGQAGGESLRISFDQRLLIPNLAPAGVPALESAVRDLGLRPLAWRDPVRLVVCAGPETCNRGLVNSKALGRELQGLELPLSLHLSGCQNGCSQHLAAPLGLQGTVRNGRPSYHLRVGRPVDAAGLRFGPVLVTLGARRVRPALERLLELWRGQSPGPGFDRWLEGRGSAGLAQDLGRLLEDGEDLRQDLGSEQAFAVALGGTECH